MSYAGNLETYLAQYPALLPTYWLDIARVYDEINEPVTFKVLPERGAPARVFNWRIHIHPADMTHMIQSEVAKTPMATSMTTYETFTTKTTRTGFYVTEDELDDGLPGVIETLTKERIDAIRQRVEYINTRCLQGFTWNAVNTGRMVLLTRPTWQGSGGTPIRDILYMTLRVWKRSGKKPVYLIIGPNEHMYLQNHTAILAEMGTGTVQGAVAIGGANDVLCMDMINCIRSLNVLRIDGFYKEDATDWANWQAATPRIGQPGRGNMNMDLEAAVNKRWFLQDRAIVTPAQVGHTFVKQGLTSRQWEDPDTGLMFWKFQKKFVPVVEDWGRIGRITFTGTTYLANREPSTI